MPWHNTYQILYLSSLGGRLHYIGSLLNKQTTAIDFLKVETHFRCGLQAFRIPQLTKLTTFDKLQRKSKLYESIWNQQCSDLLWGVSCFCHQKYFHVSFMITFTIIFYCISQLSSMPHNHFLFLEMAFCNITNCFYLFYFFNAIIKESLSWLLLVSVI